MTTETTTRRSKCAACDDVYGLDATDRCRKFIATIDLRTDWIYCLDCGHGEENHR